MKRRAKAKPALKEALLRHKRFQGRPAKKCYRLTIPKFGPIVYLGEGLAVEYRSDKKMHRADARATKRSYRHTFGARVKVYTDPKGKALLILGGRFKVTDWMRH